VVTEFEFPKKMLAYLFPKLSIAETKVNLELIILSFKTYVLRIRLHEYREKSAFFIFDSSIFITLYPAASFSIKT
jgi:hypothetical protein